MPSFHAISDLQWVYTGLSQLDDVAARVIEFAGTTRVWLLEGEMSVGKTTLAKAICRQLGVQDTVQSPTYALVNEYMTHSGNRIYHFDFYRIKDETEAMDIGVEEYFDSGNLCLVEWPTQIPSLIPADHLMIHLSLTTHFQRTIHLTKHGQ